MRWNHIRKWCRAHANNGCLITTIAFVTRKKACKWYENGIWTWTQNWSNSTDIAWNRNACCLPKIVNISMFCINKWTIFHCNLDSNILLLFFFLSVSSMVTGIENVVVAYAYINRKLNWSVGTFYSQVWWNVMSIVSLTEPLSWAGTWALRWQNQDCELNSLWYYSEFSCIWLTVKKNISTFFQHNGEQWSRSVSWSW